jgi:monofunctional chorismate mutase
MNKLEQARLIINEVDSKMIELFKERMNAARMVAEHKKENNLPVLDKAREEALIKKNIELLNDKELEQYYLTFLEGMLTASKIFKRN